MRLRKKRGMIGWVGERLSGLVWVGLRRFPVAVQCSPGCSSVVCGSWFVVRGSVVTEKEKGKIEEQGNQG